MGMGTTAEIRPLHHAGRMLALFVVLLLVFGLLGMPKADAVGVTVLTNDDFTFGTYIIDQPGTYRLGEDISFNPNSPATLSDALGVPVDAYDAGSPLPSQFLYAPGTPFTPPSNVGDARYDPAAYGVGFFAAIAIQADDVVLDLNGHTIEQSEEHALLQRFFAVIELADQPFVPSQGPAGFGDDIISATNVTIKNGTIGRSSHHGIHGNGNENIRVRNVDFLGYEVAALALNGVDGLVVQNSTAINRKDVPVLGTFSSARFIKTYVDALVRSGSTTTLMVGESELSAADVQADLRAAINNVHEDVIIDELGYIDEGQHPVEYGVFHNEHGLLDGNSYSFLVNSLGVAVNGFPTIPDGETQIPSRNIMFRNVHVVDQQAFINEIPAIDAGVAAPGSHGAATIDPIGAVFQVRNVDPATGLPVTVSSLDDTLAEYTGNPVANAQAFVAKAALEGFDFDLVHLDISRMNISQPVVNWVEGVAGSETLADIGATYLCNGDSMFHVNKGVIGFKMDAAEKVRLMNTSVSGIENLGSPGVGGDVCGYTADEKSHPAATLYGYGGAAVRAYTFAGSDRVVVSRASVTGLSAMSGPAVAYAVLTDSNKVRFVNATTDGVDAGWGDYMPVTGPNGPAYAAGFYISADSTGTTVARGCATGLVGYDGTYDYHDPGGVGFVVAKCHSNR